MYIFSNNIKEALSTFDSIISPLEPPYVQVNTGKHVQKQKLGSILSKLMINQKEIKALVEEYKEINSSTDDYYVDYSTDFVEIYSHALYAIDSVYKSCMTGKDYVRIYDYDERLSLLVAYKDNRLVLRTLVRSDKMEYVRLYIDHNFIKSHIANAIVAKAGYTEGDLEGIRLKYEETDDGDIVCPYLDKISDFNIEENESLLITRYGKFDGSTEKGFVEKEPTEYCSCCEARIPENEIFIVGDIIVCEKCIDEKYVWYNDEYYHIENCVLNNSTYELIPACRIDQEDIACTEEGDWYNIDDVVFINDYCYSTDDCVALVQEDTNGNNHALKEEAIFNPTELSMLACGYWLKEQIEEVLEELNETLDSLQTDELDALVLEITKIALLLG